MIMGRRKHDWQDRGDVLKWFGKKEKHAKKNYRRHVQEGISLGSRPELVGGGLIRSLGGWSNVISMRRHGDRDLSDERILGNGDFVEQIIKEADFTALCERDTHIGYVVMRNMAADLSFKLRHRHLATM